MSKSFLSSLDVAHCTIVVDSLTTLQSSDLDDFRRIFLQYGFGLIQETPGRQSPESLLALRDLFGDVHSHDRASLDGIARIEFNPALKDYLGCSNAGHPPHTDGTFDSSPPRIVCLQCIQNAEVGGDSILVSGHAILEHLAALDPAHLKPLFDPDAFTVERKGQSFTGPVFSRENLNYAIRFRSDSAANLHIKPAARHGFGSIMKYVLNLDNQLQFRLQPGQVLALDNSAILHGRTPFQLPSSRCLNRVNFNGGTQFCETLNLGISFPLTEMLDNPPTYSHP